MFSFLPPAQRALLKTLSFHCTELNVCPRWLGAQQRGTEETETDTANDDVHFLGNSHGVTNHDTRRSNYSIYTVQGFKQSLTESRIRLERRVSARKQGIARYGRHCEALRAHLEMKHLTSALVKLKEILLFFASNELALLIIMHITLGLLPFHQKRDL